MNEDIRRGEDAKRLLADPMLQEAFTAVETTLIDAMRRVDVGAKDRHQDLIVSLQLLHKVKGYLEQTVMTGKMSQMTEEAVKSSSVLRRMMGRA